MKIVEAQEAREKLTMPVCIDLMRTALKELEEGNWTQPVRSIAVLPGGEKFGFMPAWLKDSYGAKVLVACPQNAGTAYPSHIGYVMMFDGAHGEVMGLADASVITEVRTGAVSGVATDLLARKDAHHLAVIGAGAVVTHDIPANCIAVGNPARVLREITDEDRTGFMERIKARDAA